MDIKPVVLVDKDHMDKDVLVYQSWFCALIVGD
jgi:hypothetical protein